MNLRFWGGWFLALAGIGILLTMGCEKGALGVKPALVTGRIVDSDSGNGVANATIRMISKEKFGSSEVKQGQNFVSAVTNATGHFMFENVVPDNVLFEYSANNYVQTVYPSTESPEEGQIAQVEFVSVKSGAVLNVGDLKMSPLPTSPLAATIRVKIDLRDSVSKEEIPNNLNFEISLNGEVEGTLTPEEWRSVGKSIPSARTLKVVVRDVSGGQMLYSAKTVDLSVSGDVVEIIELDPVTYNLHLRAVNVPDYIRGGVVNIFAERPTTAGRPPKVLARQAIDDLGNLSGPNLPVLIEVPGLQEPVDVRIQVRGYKDEVITVNAANLPAGAQGNYRVDIDFLLDNAAVDGDVVANNLREGRFTYDPEDSTRNIAGMFNNMMRRDVILVVAGTDLVTTNMADAIINLPFNGVKTYESGAVVGSVVPVQSQFENMPIEITFPGVAIGYDLYYNATVYNSASGSYNISNTEGIMINPQVDNSNSALAIGVNAKRPSN